MATRPSLPPSATPIGDYTTVLDIAERDSQTDYFFPINTKNTQFSALDKLYNTTSISIQDYVHKGSADWGGKLSFNPDTKQSGDLIQGITLEFKVSHWYSAEAISKLESGEWIIAPAVQQELWGYVNGLGNAMIESIEITAGDQTLSKISGEFAQVSLSSSSNANTAVGYAATGIGYLPGAEFGVYTPQTNPINKNKPFQTPGGAYQILLPLLGGGTGTDSSMKEALPLMAMAEGTVQINITLRPFEQAVQKFDGTKSSPMDSPLGKFTTFEVVATGALVTQQNATQPPPFRDFRLITFGQLTSGPQRELYLRKPVENLMQFSQAFKFSEPLKYSVAKTQYGEDTVDITLPLELNYPTKEIMFVFKRNSIIMNNEWNNFTPKPSWAQTTAQFLPWLRYGSIYINGQLVDQGDGEWWRTNFANHHNGGISSYNNFVYGYVFARNPDQHQPSGYVNMSKATSVRLNLTVNVPPPVAPLATSVGTDINAFPEGTNQGWEVNVYSVYYNWVRFENGMAQKLFAD
jgi:Large eukaryotic DNA virus major capsid protein/Major capsid protein N-terminus